MKSFKHFLNEQDDLPSNVKKSWAVDNDASRKHALEWILSNSKYALEHNNLIFRGFRNSPSQDISYIDASQGERKSKDTNNVYQIIMDNSMFMKDYPSRSKSLICINDYYNAGLYGDVFVIFPKKQQQIVVCDTDDFLFKRVEGNLKNVFGPNSLNNISYIAGTIFSDYLGIKVNEITSELLRSKMTQMSPSSFDNFLYALFKRDTENGKQQVEKYVNSGIDRFTAICSYLMSPESLGLITYKYNIDKINLSSDFEIWFSGNALVISVLALKELLPDIEDSGVNISYILKSWFDEISNKPTTTGE